MIAAAVELAHVHTPLLAIVAPLAGAGVCVMLGGARFGWVAALLAVAACAVFSWDAALRALTSGEARFAVEGAALFADGVGLYAAALLSSVALLALIGAAPARSDYEMRAAPFALALMLVALAGLIGALHARDLVGVFIALEAAWLALVGLIAMSPERGGLNGALRMLGAGGVSAALFVLGAALLQRASGSFDLPAIADELIERSDAAALGAGLVLISVALKAGLAPLHEWVGAAFARAGVAAGVVLGAVSVVGAVAVLVRLAAYFGASPALGEGVSIALAALGGVSVVIGSLQAIGARSLPRLAAYAGIAQGGGVLLCVALGSPAGFAAALVQLTAFAATAVALLGGAATGAVRALESLDGLGRRAPIAGAAIMAGAISLMGAPLTLGFLGRWRLVEAGVGAGWWWAAGAVIFTSLAGVFYGGRLIERLYFRRAAEVSLSRRDPWRAAYAPMLLAAIFVIALGVAPKALLDVADAAAAQMTGLAP